MTIKPGYTWKAPLWRRIVSHLKWKPRHFAYWLLGIPDEIEESIGGLNWAVEQNRKSINDLSNELDAYDKG